MYSKTPGALDKKRTVVLLRSVVVISTSYLILFDGRPQDALAIGYISALILTNLGLVLAPRRWFEQPGFSAALLIGDTAVVLAGLYLTVGCFSQDFLIIYFFTIFLTTITPELVQIAIGAALISGLYGYWLWLTAGHALNAGEWLRLPFFFIVAIFYAYVTEETKRERYSRQRAEQESERLRFLFHLGGAFSQRRAAAELVEQLGSMVETAFPRLRCGTSLDPGQLQDDAVFPIESHERSYGALHPVAKDGSELRPNEREFCKVAGLVAAHALYAAEQLGTADETLRLKQEFLDTLSHELRSPLHVILGNTEMLSADLASGADASVRENLDRLRTSAHRLLDSIEEMLCFVDLRAGRTAVRPEHVDLRQLAEDCAMAMDERLAGRPIRYTWYKPDDMHDVQTDGRKLQLIVNALLSNAAKFTEEGFVDLRFDWADDALEIVVRDSGIGIDPKHFGSIFEAFRQIDGSLTRRYHGLGLGLGLARELAAALGGHISVESTPGRGSVFRVKLPLDPSDLLKRSRAKQSTLRVPRTLRYRPV